LYAAQQLAAQPEKPSEIAPANIQRVTAWTHGQLMFDNEPLADVSRAQPHSWELAPVAAGGLTVRLVVSDRFAKARTLPGTGKAALPGAARKRA
jgi:ferric-dicitrate binding protein FerR (iron transport regulator)